MGPQGRLDGLHRLLEGQAARIFDKIHTYNPTVRIKGVTPEQIRAWAKEFYPMIVKTAGDKIAAVTVIPGYDDHKLGRAEPRPITKARRRPVSGN